MNDLVMVVLGLVGAFVFLGSVAYFLQRRAKTQADNAKEIPLQSNQGVALTQQQMNFLQVKLKLENQLKSGANWFYWIAGLSVLNTLFIMVGAKWSFFIGLGITQFVDGFAIGITREVSTNTGMVIRVIALLVNLSIAGVFVLCGIFAHKRHTWALVLGMVLYASDGLIFLAFQEWLSLGFHILALYGLFSGLQAKRKLDKLEPPQAFPSAV